MTYISQRNLDQRLREALRGAKRVAVVGVGDELNVHDRLGILAAKEIEGLHLPQIRVFLAGTVPESVTAPIRRYKPQVILLVDAADMGARPGTVALVDPKTVHASLLSTHALPLSVVMEYMEKDSRARVHLIGIQPDLEAQDFTPPGPEQAGLTRLLVSIFQALVEPAARAPRVAKLPPPSKTARPKARRNSRAL